MTESARQTRVLRFEWWRYAVVAFFTLAVLGALTVLSSSDRITSFAMAELGISVTSFFAYRWHRVRTEAAAGRLTRDEFYRDPQARICGPLVPLLVWFCATLVAIIATVFLGAMKGA